MSAPDDLRARAREYELARVAYVAATVVRSERPTSAKPGDTALVLGDGTITGFVGGECAEASVQSHALTALATGEPVLLTITPAAEGADATEDVSPGAVTVHNPCLSGGTLEIFLEPVVPPPLVVLHGDAPIARSIAGLAERLGYQVTAAADGVPEDAVAVVVASHGRDEGEVLRAALDAGVRYIGLVASHRRGAAVIDALDLSEEERARIRTPAGFDIGARTPEEVALSILAEIVSSRPRGAPEEADGGVVHSVADAATATDPVCGMTVAMVDTTRSLEHDGARYWFCGSGCADAFAADPAAVLSRSAPR